MGELVQKEVSDTIVNLHVHSKYSLRDSIIKPEQLIERLNEIGQNTVAITDHGEVLGAVTIYKQLKRAGIKYIHGCEMYICDDTSIKNKDSKYYHLLVLCKNEIGRLNLNKLISLSEHPDRFYSKLRIDFPLLDQYGEGLIICSACLAGEVSKAIMAGDVVAARTIASRYQKRFGPDYYLEIQSHNDPEQIAVNKQIVELATELGIEIVVSSDAHYVWEEDRKYQNKYAFNGKYKEDGEAYVDCFIQSEQDARDRLNYLSGSVVDAAIANTHKIAADCNVDMPLSAPIMPRVDTPSEFSDNKAWLVSLCEKGFDELLNISYEDRSVKNQDRKIFRPIVNEDGEITGYSERPIDDLVDTYVRRFEYELNSLERMGFIDYILLVYSYASVGKRRGPGRGSGGGSLICYLTGITAIDPIEHGLYFERFIDVGALDLLESGQITAKELKVPDIDLDFSGESCKDVLHFLYNKYGEERVASIGKFGTQKTRGTIRDLCKVFDIDLDTADVIAKAFGEFSIYDIDNMISGEIPTVDSAADAIRYVGQYGELFEYVRKLEGLPKSFGLHACGKVIATKELDYFLPSCYDKDGIRYLQGDMHDVEDVGLVKVDVLGIRTLDHEYDALEQANEPEDYLDPKQDYTDAKTLNIFRKGDTVGIFQFASFGMRKTLKKMDVRGIDDLAVANALFRPGAMAYIDNFCRRRAGVEEVQYTHPDLEPILRNTYGIIVFQEQIIDIGRMAGLPNPDRIRKATAKKKPELLNEIKPELEALLLARGWSQAQFDKLWKDMIEFGHYSFNKSHASAYSVIAFMTAKLKAYHPAEFYAGLCNSYIGESSFVKDDADEILTDAAQHGIALLPFSFRNDHRVCSVVDGKISYAIPLIRDCNHTSADALYTIRDTDEKHFWRVLRAYYDAGGARAQGEILIALGFFSEYGSSKHLLRIQHMLELMGGTGDYIKQIKKAKIESNETLYDMVCRHGSDEGAGGKKIQSFRNLDVPAIMDEYEDWVLSVSVSHESYKNKIATQQKYLGFAPIASGDQRERSTLLVKEMYPAKKKKDGTHFGYNIVTTSIGSGIQTRWTVFNAQYKREPINVGDIIKCKSQSEGGWEKKNGYFNLYRYERIE